MTLRPQSFRCKAAVADILRIGLETPKTTADVFVEWAAHVGTIYVRVFKDGWRAGVTPDFCFEADLGRDDEEAEYSELRRIESELKAILSQGDAS